MASLGANIAELKQQVAIEAAQTATEDLQLHVNPEITEKFIVDESRKVGVPAYQFDPNATPEDKAEVAKADIPPSLSTLKPVKPTDVVSDVDANGRDKLDLLPTNSAAETPANAPTESSKEQVQPAQTTTPAAVTEEQRWDRNRTGWAPQFIQEEKEDEPTLLDHRTLLENKLEDAFYGDWYHNAGVIVFACLASWLIAVLGGGLGWVFLVMTTCGTYYRTSIRRVRRNYRDDVNRELGKQRLETDTESLEWMNSFLVKFWPIYAPVLCDSIIHSVDQVLSTSTPAFLDSLRLKTFVLGNKPPRVEHVKTYPKTEVDTVLMDWKFSFTPNDVMDLTARQLKDKINPKVALEVRVGKGVVSKGLDVIVEDFAFSGLMRVKIKLQIPFPHIERVDISFLGRPEIDYVCKPLGGDYLGFDINFIPGLENFIKEQIHGNLGPMMYDPNVFPVEIAKMLAGNPVDEAIGVLAVTLHGANNLKNSERLGNTNDPYAVISLNSRSELARTKTVNDTNDPRWNETFHIVITSYTDALTMHVYDYNEFRKDKELGVATFALDTLEQQPERDGLDLDVMYGGRHRGVLHADVRFFPVLQGRKLEDGNLEPPPELNTGVARFTIEQAKDLDGTRSLVGALNPYAVLLLNGKEVHVSNKLKRTNNPIFQNAHKELLITDRMNDRLGVIIKDERDLSSDLVIGKYQLKINDMLKMMEKGQEWYQLTGVKTGRVKMMLAWKPVALRGLAGTGFLSPIGVMRLHFKKATELRNLESMGKSDPYVRVLLSGIMRGRTVTFKNNLNPEWDEVVYVPVHTRREKLTLEVMDEETLQKDRTLGEAELSVTDYIREGDNGEYEVDDERQLMTNGLKMRGRGVVKGFLHYTVAFYPALNVVNPEEETEEEDGETQPSEDRPSTALSQRSDSKEQSEALRRASSDIKTNGRRSMDSKHSRELMNGTNPESSPEGSATKEPPKIYIAPEDLQKYQCGLLVFKLIEGHFSHSNVQLEVLLDDHMFPSYKSQSIRSKDVTFGDVGSAFVRELDMSQITLRLVNIKADDDTQVVAKLTGQTMPTLHRCLYNPTELSIKSNDGKTSKIVVSLRYIPVKMTLDPTESISNSGDLRVDVLDAADLPSADRNGFSDPYCKFRLAGKEVHKTKTQKKTLHPAWNEWFETPIKSRIGCDLKVDVYDWDFGEKHDFLGSAPINLEGLEPFKAQEVTLPLDGKSGAIRLKLLFKPSYVLRSRQGSSTFSGTFATPGKIVGAPVKGVGLVGGIVGGGVIKGATFLGRGLTSRLRSKDSHENDDGEEVSSTTPPAGSYEESPAPAPVSNGTLQRSSSLLDTEPPAYSTPDSLLHRHVRSRSSASQGGAEKGSVIGETGTARFTIVSASGFPPSANVRAIVKLLGTKPKDVHKTKAIKSSSGSIQWDASSESFKVNHVGADAQFQLRVVDHSTFGSDDVLGEALIFVDDQGSIAGKEKTVTVGSGKVVLKSNFISSEAASVRPSTSHSVDGETDSLVVPNSKKSARHSFLSKRNVSASQ